MDAPKKYIRTLASDMETLKGGGSPDLILFKQKEEGASTTLPTPVVPIPVPTPIATVQEEIIPTVQKNSPLKTYAGDFADRIKTTGASTTTVLAVEQDAHVTIPTEPPATKQKSSFILGIAGGILFLAAIAGAYFTYSRYVALSLPVPVISRVATPIVVEEQEEISGKGKELLGEIQQSLARPLAPGSIRLFSLSPVASSSIFGMLQLPAPNVLLRNIDSETSIAGLISVGEQSPFFILRVTSFGDTFSGMLQWESRIAKDLQELFPAYEAMPVSTTTPDFFTPPEEQSFVDKSVANYDVRILFDTEQREILVYGYWNQRTLVIARNSATFTELLRRLAQSRVYR